MILPAQEVKRAAMLSCGVCGEVRFVQAIIRDWTCEHGERHVEVEIDPRDYDVAERFGRVHLEPRALVCR